MFQGETLCNHILLFFSVVTVQISNGEMTPESMPQHVNEVVDSHFRVYSKTPAGNGNLDIPVILWWSERLFLGSGLMHLKCPESECYSTSDRKFISDPRTRGFYFYGTDLDPGDLPLPRDVHHEWAIYHEESPMNNYLLTHYTMLELFNHTATFRRESDYPLTTQAINSAEYLLERPPVDIATKNNLRENNNLAPVLYVQSHCDVASDRDRYVKELMKYIQVDSIGSCLHNKDIEQSLTDPVEAMEAEAFFDMISQYKFHIAFENALCEDYITEKLFRPLHVGSVPIHKGSLSVRDWMPNNHSVIIADDFQSPEELAKFIAMLDGDDEAYNKYLQYKTDGIQNEFLTLHLQKREWGNNDWESPDSLTAFECYLCNKLTERHEREKAHNLAPSISLLPSQTAKPNHLYCPQPHPSVGTMEELPGNDSWKRQYWKEEYWGALDKARAVRKMIANRDPDSSKFMQYWEEIMRQEMMLGRIEL